MSSCRAQCFRRAPDLGWLHALWLFSNNTVMMAFFSAGPGPALTSSLAASYQAPDALFDGVADEGLNGWAEPSETGGQGPSSSTTLKAGTRPFSEALPGLNSSRKRAQGLLGLLGQLGL